MTTSARREARRVIETEAEAVRGLADGLDEGFDRAVEAMKATAATSCRVVVTGIGKSGIVGQKIAATLASTGTASFFLHPSEAIHGDLGMILKGDVVLALSHSGETVGGRRAHPARQAPRGDARRDDGPARLDARQGRGHRRLRRHPRGGLPAQPRPHGLHDGPARPRRRARDGAVRGEGVPAGGLRRAPPGRQARQALPQGRGPHAHGRRDSARPRESGHEGRRLRDVAQAPRRSRASRTRPGSSSASSRTATCAACSSATGRRSWEIRPRTP